MSIRTILIMGGIEVGGLDDIAVKVINVNEVGMPGIQANIILKQITELLRSLLDSGEEGSIELTRLPLTEEDFDVLEATLGEGEIQGEVNGPGVSRFYETGISGVWWVTHYDEDDEVLSEFIEVAYCPEILLRPQEELEEGLQSLRARLFEVHLENGGGKGKTKKP